MEFAKMILGHKSKDDVTESYIRVSAKMRLRFYDYAELIVGDKSAEHGNNIRLFMDKTAWKALFHKDLMGRKQPFAMDFWESLKPLWTKELGGADGESRTPPRNTT